MAEGFKLAAQTFERYVSKLSCCAAWAKETNHDDRPAATFQLPEEPVEVDIVAKYFRGFGYPRGCASWRLSRVVSVPSASWSS
jgi:hypothetical protein